jgi:hypothetical protein
MSATLNDAKLEPALLNEADAAAFTSLSRRAFRQLITRGDIQPIRVPGMRRIAFALDDLRALVASWRTR